MRSNWCRILLASFALGTASAEPPPGYYSTAEGKMGAELRQALHNVIRGHQVIPYSSGTRFDTSDALRVLDEDPANTNNILTLYDLTSMPKESFGLATGWNREHQWCDSYGLDGVEPAYSDLHNLRAEDLNANSSRGNKFYDVSEILDPAYKLPAHLEAPWCSSDTDSWQPPETVKGDIARSLFYMTVRYTGETANEPALFLTDATNLISSTTNLMGRFGTLIHWHEADPVSSAERVRNDLIYSLFQNNRNPFVDRPEWAVAAFIPAVSLSAQGTNLILRWPATYAPTMTLEETTSLSFGWAGVPDVPALMTNNWVVTLPAPPSPRFYRLKLD